MTTQLPDHDRAGPDEVPRYQISAYTVFPAGYQAVPDVPDREAWCLTVADAGDGWAVRWRSRCIDYRGSWLFEPPTESRTAEFLHRTRFSEQAALRRARREIDELVVDGLTFAEHVAAFRAGQRALAREVLHARKRKHRRRLARAAADEHIVLTY